MFKKTLDKSTQVFFTLLSLGKKYQTHEFLQIIQNKNLISKVPILSTFQLSVLIFTYNRLKIGDAKLWYVLSHQEWVHCCFRPKGSCHEHQGLVHVSHFLCRPQLAALLLGRNHLNRHQQVLPHQARAEQRSQRRTYRLRPRQNANKERSPLAEDWMDLQRDLLVAGPEKLSIAGLFLLKNKLLRGVPLGTLPKHASPSNFSV